MTSDCPVFSVGWGMDSNTWDLALRPINFVPKVNNLTSNNLRQYGASLSDSIWLLQMLHSSRLRVALLGRKAMYSRFLWYPNACRAHLGALSVIKIERLSCSELGSLQATSYFVRRRNLNSRSFYTTFFSGSHSKPRVKVGSNSRSLNRWGNILVYVTRRARNHHFLFLEQKEWLFSLWVTACAAV